MVDQKRRRALLPNHEKIGEAAAPAPKPKAATKVLLVADSPDVRKDESAPRMVSRPKKGVPKRRRLQDHERLYPLNSPGMPIPGADTQRLAEHLGGELVLSGKGGSAQLAEFDHVLSELIFKMVRSTGDFAFPLTVGPGRVAHLPVVTGHRWDSDRVTGPIPSDVMVIGKMLGQEEGFQQRQFAGAAGDYLRDACAELGITDCGNWYVTSLMKTEHPEARMGNSTLKSPWIKEWRPALHQELRLVRPKYILCLGADALKELLGKRATVAGMEGRVEAFTYSIGRTPEEPIEHTALVMACVNPGAVLRSPEMEDQFKSALARFGQLAQGLRPDQEEHDLDHREIDTLVELEALADEIEEDITDNLLSIDAEWHGQHPQNKGSYVRSIQISWKHKSAVYIHLHAKGGAWRFDGTKEQLVDCLTRISQGRRIVGHFLASDLEWLLDLGWEDLLNGFEVAENFPDMLRQALHKVHPRGGFDTGLAAHAINETDRFGLTPQALKYTTAPRYDVAMEKWKAAYCNEHKLKKEELDGYGEAPDEAIVPYGCYDADVCRRLVYVQQRLLTSDANGQNCWEPFWMAMRAQRALLEINTTGLDIDRQKVDELTDVYMSSRAELEQRIRDWAKWPELNLNSTFQIRELLYGEDYNGKLRDSTTGLPTRLRPPKAKTLRLQPIMSTDKRPMLWPVVVERQLTGEKTPSTNKLALAILAQESQAVVRFNPKKEAFVKYDLSTQVNWVRDYRFISQVLKSVLRAPDMTEAEDGFETDDDGMYSFSGGLPSRICDDGKIRTHIWPTKETGRWSSSNPPLQNLGKRRESDYRRILGKRYKSTLRSIIVAPPGYFLVESDYIGAELYGAAMMSGDEQMIDHCLRNQLPESDPNYYDIHSNIAVQAFRLECPPTKKGLESIDKVHLRIVAKSVIFGVMYGRMAKAVALAAKEEGISVSEEEAQKIIDTIFKTYPGLVKFFADCQRRASDPRWLCNCFGRLRRFPRLLDEKMLGDIQRQAQNFPIQSLVADAMNRALDHLVQYRRHHVVDYRIVLQIHDAVLLLVPAEYVPRVVETVMPHCLSELVPIYPTTLGGDPTGAGPYRLGIETEIFKAWGEKPMPNDFLSEGLDPELGHWQYDAASGGYLHGSFKKQLWVGDAAGGVLQSLAA